MLIRPMEKMDIDDIISIEVEEFDNPSTAEELLNSVGTPSIVAQDARGEIAGYCLCAKEKGESLKIYCLAVKRGSRRKGVATAIIEHLKKQLPDQTCVAITGNVYERRLPAQCFLRSAGFECTGQKAVDTGPGEKAIALMFRYQVPFDNLSEKHISRIARKSKKSRVEKDSK